jgi:hypothetical protein
VVPEIPGALKVQATSGALGAGPAEKPVLDGLPRPLGQSYRDKSPYVLASPYTDWLTTKPVATLLLSTGNKMPAANKKIKTNKEHTFYGLQI